MSNVGSTIGLPDAIRRGHDIAIHEKYLKPAKMTLYEHRLVEVGETACDGAAIAPAAND
jgi:hypothetical protein